MGRNRIVFLSVLFFLTAGLQAFSDKLTAYEVMKKAYAAVFLAGKDASCDVQMTYLDGDVGSEKWKFKIERIDGNHGDQKMRISFDEPFHFLKYIVWKHSDRDDERWLYIPSLNIFSRIQSKEKRDNFGKFHFTYEDLTGRKVDDDNYEMIYSDGSKHYMIKGTPKNRSNVDFAYYYIYIRADDFIPVKVEFLDGDQLIRLIEVMNIENIQGHPTITRALIKDLRAGGETIMNFSNIRYDVGLSEDMFNESWLRDESNALGNIILPSVTPSVISPINTKKLLSR